MGFVVCFAWIAICLSVCLSSQQITIKNLKSRCKHVEVRMTKTADVSVCMEYVHWYQAVLYIRNTRALQFHGTRVSSCRIILNYFRRFLRNWFKLNSVTCRILIPNFTLYRRVSLISEDRNAHRQPSRLRILLLHFRETRNRSINYRVHFICQVFILCRIIFIVFQTFIYTYFFFHASLWYLWGEKAIGLQLSSWMTFRKSFNLDMNF